MSIHVEALHKFGQLSSHDNVIQSDLESESSQKTCKHELPLSVVLDQNHRMKGTWQVEDTGEMIYSIYWFRALLQLRNLNIESEMKGKASIFSVISVRVFDQGIMDITNIEPRDKNLEEMYSSYLPNLLKVI